MTFGELVDRVIEVTGLAPEDAAKVAGELYGAERAYTEAGIRYAAENLGLTGEQPVQQQERTPEPQMTMDPAEVLGEVYRACPRCLPKQEGHDRVYMPRVGRAPKESVFYSDELRAQLDALPEHIRVLIGHVSVFEGTVTFTLYDEANDVDRFIGPIDLTRFADGEQLREAIEVLIGRLGRVLAADFN